MRKKNEGRTAGREGRVQLRQEKKISEEGKWEKKYTEEGREILRKVHNNIIIIMTIITQKLSNLCYKLYDIFNNSKKMIFRNEK